MNKKILIFDFDGTIADSRELLFKTFNQLSKKYGFAEIKKEEIEIHRNKTIKELFHSLKISWIKLPLLLIEYRKNYSKSISNIKFIVNMDEILQKLHKKNYLLGIVSSNSKENVSTFLRKNKLDVFNFIHSGKSLFGKDRILVNLINKHKFIKEQVIYIGDEVRDIEAAKKSGIKVIAVTWGFQSKIILQKYNPDYIVDSPEDLYALIQNRF